MRVDHITQALDKLRPRLRRDPNARKVLSAIMAQLQSADNLLLTLLMIWTLSTSRTPLDTLKQIGNLLEVPYDASMSAETYRRLLQLRIRSRKSEGTFEDVLAVANLLRAPGTIDQATIAVLHPHALQVEIPNPLQTLIAKIRSVLLDAIQETTQLDITTIADTEGGVIDGQYIILGENGPGFGYMLAPTI